MIVVGGKSMHTGVVDKEASQGPTRECIRSNDTGLYTERGVPQNPKKKKNTDPFQREPRRAIQPWPVEMKSTLRPADELGTVRGVPDGDPDALLLCVMHLQVLKVRMRGLTLSSGPWPPGQTGSFGAGSSVLSERKMASRHQDKFKQAATRPAFSIQHPASSIQHPASSIPWPSL